MREVRTRTTMTIVILSMKTTRGSTQIGMMGRLRRRVTSPSHYGLSRHFQLHAIATKASYGHHTLYHSHPPPLETCFNTQNVVITTTSSDTPNSAKPSALSTTKKSQLILCALSGVPSAHGTASAKRQISAWIRAILVA